MTKDRAIELSVELRRIRQRLGALAEEVRRYKSPEGEFFADNDYRLQGQTIAKLESAGDAISSAYIMLEVWQGVRDEAEKQIEPWAKPKSEDAPKEDKFNVEPSGK